MRELLIRYLLGELEEHEQQQLEKQLRDSADLRSELAHLRTCFAAACEFEPTPEELPRGLAERTALRVSNVDDEAELPKLSSAMITDSPPASALGWSLADLTVAGGVFLAVSMLLFPALRDSRDATRATICQDHQRQLFGLLTSVAEANGGYFPRIEPDMNAGMFAVQLVDSGRIAPADLAVLLVCPSAPVADEIRNGTFTIQIPTAAQLAAMSPREAVEVRAKMSPCFAYQFPYRSGNRYIYRIDDRQPFAPILSDTANATPGEMTSPNHRGVMQVLFADGSVQLFQSSRVPSINDDLYRNAEGAVAAGCNPRDAVLGRSEAMPGIEFVSN